MNLHNSIEKAIHEYFGYQEDWAVIPIMPSFEYFWRLNQEEDGSGSVTFANTEALLQSEDEDYYEHEIYTNRHLPKGVYETDDYTMICVDTGTDGNKFLSIFDNTKKRQ